MSLVGKDELDVAMTAPFDATLLDDIRSRFLYVDEDPFSGQKRAFLENGGGSLTLKSVVHNSAEVMGIPDGSSRGNAAARQLLERINAGKMAARCFFGAGGDDSGQLVTAATGTEILFRLARTILLQSSSGSVVSSCLEHAASHDAAGYWASRLGFRHISVALPASTGVIGPDDYAHAVKADTVLATVIHTSHVTGMRADLSAIVKAIRSKSPSCFVLCDGIQHAAHGPIDVGSYDVDAYVFSPYKVFSHRSGALGWIAHRLAVMPHEKMEGKAAENWDLGGRDPALFAGLAAVVDYLSWLGGRFTKDAEPRSRVVAAMQAVNRHEAGLIHFLIHGKNGLRGLIDLPRVTVIGETGIARREGAVSFNVRGRSSRDVVAALEAQGARTHFRLNEPSSSSRFVLQSLGLDDCVRVSFCHYNTAEEVGRVLSVLSQLV